MKKLLNKIRDAKLRTKLSLVILLVGIVPILLLSQTLLSEFGGIMRSEESTSMNTSLQQATATVENQVTQDGLLCRYVVFSDSIQQVLSGKDTDLYDRYQLYSQSAKQILNTSRYLQKGAQSITIYSQNIPVSSGTSLQPLQNMQEKDWYYQIQPGSGLQWFLDSTAPNTLDSVCLTSNYLGTGKSYLVVRYSLSTFLQPFCEMKQKNTDVAVFRGDKLLYSTGTLAKSSTSQANAAAAMRSRGTCEKRHISGLNWDVYLCADGSVISDAARAAFFRTAMIFLLCLLILVAMDRLFSHTMTRSIEALTANMVAVSQGDMTVRVSSNAKDEVGTMIQTFRKMVQRIDKLIHKIYETQRLQKEAEIKALQSQINPHFLYNTLSMINWKALAAGEKDISRITLLLSSFYRTTLNRGRSMTTAGDELKNVRAYLDLQLMMHDGNFQVEWHADHAADPYQMPKLLLQPIVENALEHGLDVKETGERCLSVSAELTNTDVVFTVRDNGVGMPQKTAEQIIHCETSGYGMKNVNDRVVLLYGPTYALQIESEPGRGTCVTVRIPKSGEEGGKT